MQNLCQNAADSPNINARAVDPGTEQELRRTVPACDHDMGVNSVGRSVNFCQTEIADLEDAFSVDQQVVGLDIPMQDPMLVQIFEACKSVKCTV